jgi:midasin
VAHFAAFSAIIHGHLTSERSALETEIRNLIKLASWKDVNVHALKQSAQRTHRQLYKVIRKFREVLRRPVSKHLEAVTTEILEEGRCEQYPLNIAKPSSPNFTTPVSGASVGMPTHLIHLGRTYKRFEEIVTERIGPFISAKSPHIVDTLAVDIILSSKELSSISVPSSLPTERREKLHKAVLTRKRKAWSDLMKELKKAGFTSHVKPEILLQNCSTRWIRERPALTDHPDPAWDIQKSETYWNRLNTLFPLLRATIPSHHTDVSTRELQRGVAFLESGFTMAIELRTRYVYRATLSKGVTC